MNFIPEGVTAIESGQFRNGTFTEIEIPASVTCIESGAFLDCCQLQRVYFNAVNCKTCGKKTMPVFGNYGDVQVTYNYGYFGVTNMNVVEILIGEGVKTIPNFLLTGTNVASFHIPASVEKVGLHAFCRAAALESITVDPQNPRYYTKDGALIEKKTGTLICVPPMLQLPRIYEIPKEVTILADGCFDGHKELKTIRLHSGITKYDKQLIRNFKLELEGTEPSLSLEGGVLFGTKLMKYKKPKNNQEKVLYLPDGITEIGDYAFEGVLWLDKIVCPPSVSNFGKEILRGTSVDELVIQNARPHFSRTVLNQSRLMWLTVVNGGKMLRIYLPDGTSAVARSRALSALTQNEAGEIAVNAEKYVRAGSDPADTFMANYFIASQLGEDPDAVRSLRLTMKNGVEYWLRNNELDVQDFQTLFHLGAITKTNQKYLIEFSEKYGKEEIAAYLRSLKLPK